MRERTHTDTGDAERVRKGRRARGHTDTGDAEIERKGRRARGPMGPKWRLDEEEKN